MKNKRWLITLCSVFLGIIMLASAAFFLWKTNTYTLELENDGHITLEYGVEAEIYGQHAVCRGNIFHRDGVEVPVTINGEWNPKELGTYQIVFKTKFAGKNVTQKGFVEIVDTLPPKITLVTNPDSFTNPSKSYEEEGYQAIDLCDGDVTANVVREERDGKVYYTATDSHGNTATKEREIIYKDVIAPIINLTGGADYKHQLGQVYAEPGFKAVDECDGDISGLTVVEGDVDGKKAGTYTITYRATDSSGNVGEIKRTIKVADYQAPVLTLKGQRELYLKVGRLILRRDIRQLTVWTEMSLQKSR